MTSGTDAPRRLSLLYQLYLASQASRGFMRLALSGTGMSGEEYAVYSYLFANGARTLSEAARDLGVPLTTLATLVAPGVGTGEVERWPHPRDRRARLLALTPAGRARLEAAIPPFSAAYDVLLRELEAERVGVQRLFAALDELRLAMTRATERLEQDRAAATA